MHKQFHTIYKAMTTRMWLKRFTLKKNLKNVPYILLTHIQDVNILITDNCHKSYLHYTKFFFLLCTHNLWQVANLLGVKQDCQTMLVLICN